MGTAELLRRAEHLNGSLLYRPCTAPDAGELPCFTREGTARRAAIDMCDDCKARLHVHLAVNALRRAKAAERSARQ